MSAGTHGRRVPLLLWPFWAVWRLLAFILEFTGRTVGVVLALVLLILGAVASITVIGAVIGVPLIVVGLSLLARALC